MKQYLQMRKRKSAADAESKKRKPPKVLRLGKKHENEGRFCIDLDALTTATNCILQLNIRVNRQNIWFCKTLCEDMGF